MSRIIILFFVVSLAACAHQSVTWDRTKQAARGAATHPSVWAPLLGASLFTINNLDNRTSKNLSEQTPLFGNKNSAQKASSEFQTLLELSAGASALMAPVSDTAGDVSSRGDRLALVMGGLVLTGGVNEGLKTITDRERPNKKGSNSLPSGHASIAFASATFASENVHRAWGDSARAHWTDAGLYTMASLTAWARVEAGKHHPSDVLVGAALGDFMGRFLDALLLTDSSNTSLSSFYDGSTFLIGVEHVF